MDIDNIDFNYVATYPDGTSGQFSCEEFQELKKQFGSKPLIILLGWAGCQDQYLAKYSQLYDKKGYVTVRYIAPLSAIVHQRYNLRPIAKRLTLLLRDIATDSQPILFHIFSNGGASVYQQFSQLAVKDDGICVFNIIGCIFDSAPTEVSSLTGAKAAMAIMRFNVIIKWVAGILLFLFYSIRQVFDKIRLSLKDDLCARGRMYSLLLEEPSFWPQLFIYSKTDKICDYKSIEDFHKGREKIGIPVKVLCFDDSPHVSHLRTHPELYTNEVYSFLNNCKSKSSSFKED